MAAPSLTQNTSAGDGFGSAITATNASAIAASGSRLVAIVIDHNGSNGTGTIADLNINAVSC